MWCLYLFVCYAYLSPLFSIYSYQPLKNSLHRIYTLLLQYLRWFQQPIECSAWSEGLYFEPSKTDKSHKFVRASYSVGDLEFDHLWWGEYDVARPETPQWPRRLTSLTTPTVTELSAYIYGLYTGQILLSNSLDSPPKMPS